MATLTRKQRRFVEEYLVDLNATQAALRAGYKHPDNGRQLLTKTHVAAAIEQGQSQRAARTEITADRVLKEIAKVAFADVRKVFNADGALIKISDLSDEAAACIAGCDLVTMNKGEGEIEYVAKIKMADKLRALELCGKHLGMFRENAGAEDVPLPTRVVVEVVDGRKP